jgi:ribosome-associated protein
MQRLNVGDRPINLTQVLKRANLVENGGEAKAVIGMSMVRVNGEIELRKRRQMALGDTVQVEGLPPVVLANDEESP